MKVKPLAVLEGIIGCGKSTLAKKIGETLNFRVFQEPVGSNPYLTRFYKDPKRWAFPMQIALLFRRFAMQKTAAFETVSPDSMWAGAVIDRSLPGDRCFCSLHMKYGNIDPLEWETYQDCYEIMSCSLIPPGMMIFLDTEPKVAYERIKTRGREAEKNISIEYLQDLQKGYYDLLVEMESGIHPWSRGQKLIKIPWNVDHQDPQAIIDMIEHHCHIK